MKKLLFILLLLVALPLAAFAQNDDVDDDVDDDADDDSAADDDTADDDTADDDTADDDTADDDQDIEEELEHEITIWIEEAVQEDNNVRLTIYCKDLNRRIHLRRINRNFSAKPLDERVLVGSIKISDQNPTPIHDTFFGVEKDVFQIEVLEECAPSGSNRYALQNRYEDGSAGRLSTYTLDVTGTSAECGGVERPSVEDDEDDDDSSACAIAGKNDKTSPALMTLFAAGLAFALLRRRR